ncbi:hypothetical protein CRUP_037949, partial [Coryphaenoides rupestris]
VLSASRSSPTKPNVRSMTITATEGAAPGSIIGQVRLPGDGDGAGSAMTDGQTATYLVVGGTDQQGTFMVDRAKGDVYLVRELDYEEGSRYTLHVEVSDFSRAFPSSHRVRVDIQVLDSNDHAPQFTEDPDGSGPNSDLRYTLEHCWPSTPDLLSLHPTTGVLTLGRPLDREATATLYLVVRASDQPPDPARRRWASVTARVFGENGRVTYRIQTGNSAGRFSLNPNT